MPMLTVNRLLTTATTGRKMRRSIQVVIGLRQVGKITLVAQVTHELPVTWTSFDELTLRGVGWITQQWWRAIDVQREKHASHHRRSAKSGRSSGDHRTPMRQRYARLLPAAMPFCSKNSWLARSSSGLHVGSI